jgi:hypothetical protein
MNKDRKEKRYQELGYPYRMVRWLRWMPVGYIKAFWWYFVKRLKWEDCGDEGGRLRWSDCVDINVGMVQYEMGWYYTTEEVFRELELVGGVHDGKCI